ncbi:MAG TPA: ABC transporter permease, partial [Cyclobacteriaceae bacterium]|nr:ABC transporter permease [Cyclobacteriaceae bacterium]
MIKNNLKVSLRVFSRNKAYTFINVLGLSTGLAIALLILVYVRFELSYEGKNPLADRIVRISVDLYNGKSLIDQDAEMYSPAGPRIASGFSEVESFTRVAPFNDATIRIGEESLRESKMFAVDSSFFHLFNYSLLYGNPKNIFQRPNEMVLTESQALKYFNRVNVVGESLWVSSFDEGFRIIGVVANNPLNTHIQFNVLISYPTIQDQAEKQSWGNNETYTYLLLKDQVTFNSFVKTLDSFNDQLHKEGKMLSEKILAQPIKDIHLYSHKSYEMGQNGDATSVYFLLGVALLVIVIAIVNYINLSTSKSLDRAKEVGVRKVIGSS